jgi:uncharacterized protein YbaR (Trm112 family)
MLRDWLAVLLCPACGGTYELDATRRAGDEIVEGFLICQSCLETRFIAGGSAVLPRHLERHLREQGGVYRRTPLADPRLVRFVLARLGAGDDHVPFEEVTARYGDLAETPEAVRPAAPEDVALAAWLERRRDRRFARALDLGTGVGRGAFLLRTAAARVLGVDGSAARVRRARNLAATEEGFRLRVPDDPKREVGLALGRLTRDGVDWSVVDPERLPCAAGAFDLVVLRAGDGRGPWQEPAAVRAEAQRVLARDGVLLTCVGADVHEVVVA